jgi:hypothetical protein
MADFRHSCTEMRYVKYFTSRAWDLLDFPGYQKAQIETIPFFPE